MRYGSTHRGYTLETCPTTQWLRRPPSAGEGPKAPWQSGDSAALPAQDAARRKPTPHPPTKSRRHIARGAEGGEVATAPLRGLLTGVGMAEISFLCCACGVPSAFSLLRKHPPRRAQSARFPGNVEGCFLWGSWRRRSFCRVRNRSPRSASRGSLKNLKFPVKRLSQRPHRSV